jgi:hypothetical protein
VIFNISKYKLIYVVVMFCILIFIHVCDIFAADVILSWDPPQENINGTALDDLEGYYVYYGTEPDNYTQSIDVGIANTFAIDNLTGGLVYYFAVTAYDIYGNESSYSNQVSQFLSVYDTASPTISGVYESDITYNSATIHWTTDEPADSMVEFGTTLSYGHTTSSDSTLATTHSKTIYVASSTQYYYRVISRDASGNVTVSPNYTFISADEPDVTPPAISNVQITNITSSSATISWMTDEPSSSQVEYGLDTSYGNTSSYDSRLVTVHSLTITGLSGYTMYDFRVWSMDGAYNEGFSDNYTFSTSSMPPDISTFSVNPETAYIFDTVSFTAAASDSDGFVVRYEWDFDGDGDYDSDTGPEPQAFHSYNNAGVYNARLRVTDNEGLSTLSDMKTVMVDSSIDQVSVTVSLSASPVSGSAPLSVIFAASLSDVNTEVSTFEWDLDGNGIYEIETITSPISTTYLNHGTYSVRVRVTDVYGATATGEAIVKVYKNSSGKKRSSSDTGTGKKTGQRR